jgi:uridine phosphorylase
MKKATMPWNEEGPGLYTRAARGKIAKHVIFSGDPWRVEILKDLLDSPEHIAFAREFNTYTGRYRNVPITVTSTGIGAPSAAIAMEEMYRAGMEVAIRMGTIMGLRDDLLGKFIIPIGAMRGESTSATYVPASYPAVADIELVSCMGRAVRSNGREYVNGIVCSLDGFYSQMKGSRLSDQLDVDTEAAFEKLKRYRISGIDMESSCILTLASLMGIKGCVVTMTTVLENLRGALEGDARKKAEEVLCKVVLDGILLHEKGN